MRHAKHFVTRSLPVLLASALLGLGAVGCGAAGIPDRSSSSVSSNGLAPNRVGVPELSPTVSTSLIPPGQHVRGDADADNPTDIDGNGDLDGARDKDNDHPVPNSYRFPDKDDKAIFAYGHAPSAAAERAITSVVKRYYAAISSNDGATACSLLLPNLARTIPTGYTGSSGPTYLRGVSKTCQAVLSKFFQPYHKELAAPIEVADVRVNRSSALVILSSRTMRAGNTFLTHQDNSWWIEEVLGQPLP